MHRRTFAQSAADVLGINVGGTTTSVVVGSADGTLHDRIAWPTNAARGPEPLIAEIVAHGHERLAHFPIARAGVAIGGPMRAPAGIIESPPHLPGWDDLPLGDRLREAFGLPVTVEHDAAACALAEYRWGTFAGAESLVYLTAGTGFGAGIVVRGRALYGAHGASCELGHGRYADDGPTVFGKRGSIEAYGPGSALPRLAAWRFPHRWPDETAIDAPGLAQLAAAGDTDALEILRLNAVAVGQVAANLADLFAPNALLLGSLARYLGEPWLAIVRTTFAAEVHPRIARLCTLAPATLGAELQDLSGVAAALTD